MSPEEVSTTPGKSGNSNEGLLHIPQSSQASFIFRVKT